MKKLFSALFLSLIFNGLIAQHDSIRNEILNYQDSKEEIISKARRLLLDKFVQDDFHKMQSIKDYLKNEVEDPIHLTLYIAEYWLVLYWTQDFEELLNHIEHTTYSMDKKRMEDSDNQIRPRVDKLFETLREKSRESKIILETIIHNGELNAIEKDFLLLHLNYCLSDYSYKTINQDSLNKQSDNFIIKYPSSPYVPFVKKVIQYKEKVSDFGFAYELSAGYGTFQGGLAKNFADYVPLGLALDINYKNFNLLLSANIGWTRLKQDIELNSVTWDKNMRGDIIIPMAALGYTVFAKKRINITPYFGISAVSISPQYDDMQNYPPLEDLRIDSDALWCAGVSLNLYTKPIISARYNNRSSQFRGYLKFRYHYFDSKFSKDLSMYSGAAHNVTLSFGGELKRVRRMY